MILPQGREGNEGMAGRPHLSSVTQLLSVGATFPAQNFARVPSRWFLMVFQHRLQVLVAKSKVRALCAPRCQPSWSAGFLVFLLGGMQVSGNAW